MFHFLCLAYAMIFWSLQPANFHLKGLGLDFFFCGFSQVINRKEGKTQLNKKDELLIKIYCEAGATNGWRDDLEMELLIKYNIQQRDD